MNVDKHKSYSTILYQAVNETRGRLETVEAGLKRLNQSRDGMERMQEQ